jgi:hemolysin activation/secretion protein
MKKSFLFVAALFFLTFSAWAQEPGQQDDRQAERQAMRQQMMEELQLNEEQKQAATKIWTEAKAKLDEIRIADLSRRERMMAAKEVKRSTDAQLKEILTEEQFAIHQKYMEKRKMNRRSRR